MDSIVLLVSVSEDLYNPSLHVSFIDFFLILTSILRFSHTARHPILPPLAQRYEHIPSAIVSTQIETIPKGEMFRSDLQVDNIY